MPSERPVFLLVYLDVVLVALGAPIMIAIGVSGLGYGVGAGAWVLLRALGVGIERVPALHRDARTDVGTRLAYMLARLFLLALAIILARSQGGRDGGLAALAVIVFAFTVALAVSAITRPRKR